jgi:hypothetical protein
VAGAWQDISGTPHTVFSAASAMRSRSILYTAGRPLPGGPGVCRPVSSAQQGLSVYKAHARAHSAHSRKSYVFGSSSKKIFTPSY